MTEGEFSLVKELLINIDKKQDKLAEKVEKVREQTSARLDHLDDCVDSVRDAVKENHTEVMKLINAVADAIPNRDFHGHLIAHSSEMDEAKEAKELKLEAKKAAINYVVPGILLFVCLALWEAFKARLFQ